MDVETSEEAETLTLPDEQTEVGEAPSVPIVVAEFTVTVRMLEAAVCAELQFHFTRR